MGLEFVRLGWDTHVVGRIPRRSDGRRLRMVVAAMAAVGGACSSAPRVETGRNFYRDMTATTTLSASVQPYAAAAVALGQQMSNEVLLPPQANRFSGTEPAAYDAVYGLEDIGDLTLTTRLYTVAEPPSRVAQWLQAHVPNGMYTNGRTIGMGSVGKLHFAEVDNFLRLRPPNISLAEVRLRAEDDGTGNTIIRADAAVAWTEPRLANEYVPAQDHVVTVTVVHASRTSPHVATAATLIDPVIRTFNDLRVNPPLGPHGFIECGTMSASTVSYEVAFSTTRTSTPDLVAGVGQCGGVSVTVHGHKELALQDDRFSTTVARVLGLTDGPHWG
jgi:hypothetical protein